MSTALTKAERAARVEDLEWMTAGGASGHEAAQRLGLTWDALWSWAHVNTPHLVPVLARRNPLNLTRRGNAA